MTTQGIYELALAKNGTILQRIVAIEELSELVKELTKDLRNIGDLDHIAEEMADVEIVLEQLKIIYDNKKLVDKFKVNKLKRLKINMFGDVEELTKVELINEIISFDSNYNLGSLWNFNLSQLKKVLFELKLEKETDI